MPEHTTATPFLANTACWTASARAKESEREDRLSNDPWAAALAGEESAQWLARQASSPLGIAPMIVRTRFFDDFLQDAACQQGIRQVVILGAGLDTRAFRMEWPGGARLFELDQEPVLQYKEQVLQAAGARPARERHTVARDLTELWSDALLAGGYNPQQPSAWLLEGFLFCLPGESITQIINQVSGLAARGWQASLTQPGAPDANFGRWTPPVFPSTMPGVPHNWHVTAGERS